MSSYLQNESFWDKKAAEKIHKIIKKKKRNNFALLKMFSETQCWGLHEKKIIWSCGYYFWFSSFPCAFAKINSNTFSLFKENLIFEYYDNPVLFFKSTTKEELCNLRYTIYISIKIYIQYKFANLHDITKSVQIIPYKNSSFNLYCNKVSE